MENTLHLMSVQHELGMAIGHDLRLHPMLQHFTRVAIKRLGLAGIHLFLATNDKGKLTHSHNWESISLNHYMSYPAKDANAVLECKQCINITTHYNKSSEGLINQFSNGNESVYVFGLSELGAIILKKSGEPLDQASILLLNPIFSRLALSCRASIEHERLLEETSARISAEKQILYQLHHDDLTQLPNRRLFKTRLEQELARCKRHNSFGGLMFMDLDRFKMINDTLGHSAGDELLQAVSTILQDTVRKEDTVSRFGGDEFVILITELGNDYVDATRNMQSIAEKLFDVFSQPIVTSSNTIHVSISIGIDIFPDNNKSADDGLKHADVAMYQAKDKIGNSAVFFDHAISSQLQSRLELEKDLREAINTEQFELYYQPQFNISHEIIGAEALIRWKHAERGFISPAEFIPVAESAGLILEIGNWVLHTACKHIRKLESHGLPRGFDKVSVNASAIQLAQNNFVDTVIDCINDSSIDSRHLGIELTETTLIKNIDETISKISVLSSLGIHFSIDDFGTGYSSLMYLNRIPIETLKIDQAFIRNIDSGKGNKTIAQTIIALAKELKLSVIAEGVETKEELDCLSEIGCSQYQGYYFSKPVCFEEFESLLTSDLILEF